MNWKIGVAASLSSIMACWYIFFGSYLITHELSVTLYEEINGVSLLASAPFLMLSSILIAKRMNLTLALAGNFIGAIAVLIGLIGYGMLPHALPLLGNLIVIGLIRASVEEFT